MSAVRNLEKDRTYAEDFDPMAEALRAWEIRRSDPKESHRLALELIDHALEFDDPMVTGWSYLTCAAHELGSNEFEQAEESARCAVKLFRRVGEKRGESLGVILCARSRTDRGNFQSALEIYKSVIEREAHGLMILERFEAFNSIAACFWGLDNTELCLMYLSKAFDVLRNTSHATERATVLSNIGACLLAVGNYEVAKEFLLAASKVAPDIPDALRCMILSNLVSCHTELKEDAAAGKVAHQMLSRYQEAAFSGPNTAPLCNAALAFAGIKEWKLSDICLSGARKMADEFGQQIYQLPVAQTEAIIEGIRGNFAVAAARTEWLLENYEPQLTNEIKSQLYSLLVTCYQNLANPQQMLAVKSKRLKLNDIRYRAGLTAAMVVLDLRASLNS